MQSIDFSDFALTAKACLVCMHLLGLVLGLGAATILDLVMLRFFFRRKISTDHYDLVYFSSKIVTVGLALLWISGIGFLIHYSVFNPDKLANSKIYAKVLIVLILTLNGVVIHRVLFPLMRARIGGSLLDGLPPFQRVFILCAGAISGVSWYVPFLLGAFPQFNFVPATTILAGYAVLLVAVIAGAQGMAVVLMPRKPTVTLTVVEYNSLVATLAQRDQMLEKCFRVMREHRIGGSAPEVQSPARQFPTVIKGAAQEAA